MESPRRSDDEALLLGRGVWKAPFLINGNEVLLAINSQHDILRFVQLLPGLDEDIEATALEALLDRVDRVTLKLVAEPAPTHTAPDARPSGEFIATNS
jgi:hypothetical protein